MRPYDDLEPTNGDARTSRDGPRPIVEGETVPFGPAAAAVADMLDRTAADRTLDFGFAGLERTEAGPFREAEANGKHPAPRPARAASWANTRSSRSSRAAAWGSSTGPVRSSSAAWSP